MVNNKSTPPDEEENVDLAVGRALHNFRLSRNLTIKALGEAAQMSPGMISRIENGQVSPSLSSLTALAEALDIPLISLFRHTMASTDVTFVKCGQGLRSHREADNHQHDFSLLGYHKRDDMRFEPVLVTLKRKPEDKLPVYNGHGCLFIYLLEGEGVYQCNDNRYHLKPGDSLSFDAAARHGFVEVVSEAVRFLSVGAQAV